MKPKVIDSIVHINCDQNIPKESSDLIMKMVEKAYNVKPKPSMEDLQEKDLMAIKRHGQSNNE